MINANVRGNGEKQRAGDGRTARTPAAFYRLDRLRLRHLRLLDVIDSRGSLGNAARELRMSQPAVTVMLRELEQVFASTLVMRSATGCTLTAAGRQALVRLRIAMASVDRALDAARRPDAVPLLRVGCVQLAGVAVLPAAIARLQRSGTLGQIQVVEGRANDLLRRLADGALDCVVGWVDEAIAATLPVSDLLIRQLGHGRMQVVASPRHPLARNRRTRVAELAEEAWIVARPGSRTHDAFRRLFVTHGVPAPTPALECSAIHTAMHIVASTRLVAIAPNVIAASYARKSLVVPLRGGDVALERNPVCLITRRDSDALPVVTGFRQAVMARVRDGCRRT
jgi:molybdate transport repressor ModE-like protein